VSVFPETMPQGERMCCMVQWFNWWQQPANH